MIDNDIRNNSAWNHRYYIFYETKKSLDSDAIQEEVNFCLQKIRLAPNNESAWNYLRGILQEVGLSKNEMVNEYCEEMLNNDTANCHLIQFILDAIEESLRESFKSDETLVRKAVDLTIKLEKEIDPLRKEYWIFIRKSFLEEFSNE
jgi:protein farnesyltransferase/geranylgeranyltransferase type-1 subunit alpha